MLYKLILKVLHVGFSCINIIISNSKSSFTGTPSCKVTWRSIYNNVKYIVKNKEQFKEDMYICILIYLIDNKSCSSYGTTTIVVKPTKLASDVKC